MDFGTALAEKRDLAVASVAAVGFLAAGTGNRLGAHVLRSSSVRRLPARAGRPALLGLVRTVSWDPRKVVLHHVVLGYGLREPGGGVEVAVYDPNHPRDDSVRLLVAPDGTVTHTRGGTVVAFTVVGRSAGPVR
jgi:uncharacterized protein (DUF58 family)